MPSESTSQFNDIHIILAEDNPDHQHLLLRALVAGRPRTEVCVVRNGAEFLNAVREKRFDCAVMDFNLADYRADELIREAASYMVGCPIVVTSCSQDQTVVIDSFRSGVVDFVTKASAIDGDTLWRSVEQAMKSAQAQLTERRKQERRVLHLVEMSETDPLTGLYNRRYFNRCVSDRRWTNDRRRMMCCVLIDIDHFKHVNDNYGHNVGDHALQAVSKAIKSRIHGSDIAVRWGGEEILVLRPSYTLTEAWLWSEDLRAHVERMRIMADFPELTLTVSIGIVCLPADGVNEDAIAMADEALYMAKSQGRNQTCTHAMTLVDKLLDETLTNPHGTLEERFEAFIGRCNSMLGPTQREHLIEHSQKVSHMAMQIARILQVDRETYEMARLAGMVHDIGKCMIPEELLAKPSWLTLPERSLMARHAELGAYITARLGANPDMVYLVRKHHMRFDSPIPGDGSNQVLLVGRILNAADAIVTMLTDRPYRKAMSPSEALCELRRERDRQFDSDVVEAAHFVGLDQQLVA